MCEHIGAVPVTMQRSTVHVSWSSQLYAALRMHRRRAGSQLHVPVHGLPLSRAHVVSPISHGSSVTQPVCSAQNWLPGHRMSLAE